MSETRCVQCGNNLAATDNFCPSCGRPRGKAKVRSGGGLRDHYILWGVLVAAAAIFIVMSLVKGDKKEASSETQMPPSMPADQSGGTMQTKPISKEAFIKNLPPDYDALISMGNALMDQGHYELAVECYNRGLQQKPHEVDVRVDLGACMHFLGKNQEAIDNFKKALEDNPRHQVAKLNLGVAYMSMGDSAQAGSWWRQLLSENPPEELKTRTETFLKQLGQP
jgi:tetratricopeptide (TPR) repeat protein